MIQTSVLKPDAEVCWSVQEFVSPPPCYPRFTLEVTGTRMPEKRPCTLTTPFLEQLTVGCFALLQIENYEKTTVIDKVLDTEKDNFRVHYWKVTYLGRWFPQHLPRRRSEQLLDNYQKRALCAVGSRWQRGKSCCQQQGHLWEKDTLH